MLLTRNRTPVVIGGLILLIGLLFSIGVVIAAAPDAPTNVVATRGNAQATVTWDAPASDGGSPITGYTITSTPATVTKNTAATDTTVTFTDLTNGQQYIFGVFATNLSGTSPVALSNAVTPDIVPGAPTIGVATRGNTQATVTWTAPTPNGGTAILFYTVTSNPGAISVTTTPGVLTGTVTGLTNGTSYTFTVTATNADGEGAASAASNAVTPDIVPNAPTGVIHTGGSGQATVAWTAPAGNGGTAITSYTVTSNPDNKTATVGGTTLVATVTGLTNGTTYTFTVKATNADGEGLASAASTDDIAADATWNGTGWFPQVAGNQVRVSVVLGKDQAGQVFAIKVLLAGTTTPAFVRALSSGGAFPVETEVSIDFDFGGIDAATRQAVLDAKLTPLVQVSDILFMSNVVDAKGTYVVRMKSSATEKASLADLQALVPAPPAPPEPAPTPTPPPAIVVPEADVKAAPVPTGGAAKIVQPTGGTLNAPDGSVTVAVPASANATNKTFQVVYAPLTAGVPAASLKTQVLRAFDLTTYDTDGAKATITLVRSVTITAKYTDADSQAAPDKNPANLRILSYDDTTKVWSILNTNVDIINKTLSAQTSHLSLFAVGSAEPAPQTPAQLETPTPTPTATPVPPTATPTPRPATPTPPGGGDFAPGSGVVLLVMMAGLLMVLGGATYITQSRRSRV